MFSDSFLGPLLKDRDIVILDQRGAGHSIPRLDCPESDTFGLTAIEQNLDRDATRELVDQAIPVCARRAAADGVDLAQYNVLSIVEDIDDARRALGYDRIAFYGASYGSQIGQQMLREHPETLESVILDGASALSARSWVQDRVRDVDDSLARIDALCEADARCAATFDVLGLADQVMAVFDEGPIEVEQPHPEDPARTLTFEIGPEEMSEFLFGFQTGQIAIHSMPYILATMVADGRASVAAMFGQFFGEQYLAARNPAPQEISVLAHAAIVCSDDPVRDASDLDVPERSSKYARIFGQTMLRKYSRMCADIDVPELPASTDIDATADVPTLILSGALDARTPTYRSEEVADYLPRSSLMIFPENSHVQLGEVNLCAADIVVRFLADPGSEPDGACIKDMPKRGFTLLDGTSSLDAAE